MEEKEVDKNVEEGGQTSTSTKTKLVRSGEQEVRDEAGLKAGIQKVRVIKERGKEG